MAPLQLDGGQEAARWVAYSQAAFHNLAPCTLTDDRHSLQVYIQHLLPPVAVVDGTAGSSANWSTLLRHHACEQAELLLRWCQACKRLVLRGDVSPFGYRNP